MHFLKIILIFIGVINITYSITPNCSKEEGVITIRKDDYLNNFMDNSHFFQIYATQVRSTTQITTFEKTNFGESLRFRPDCNGPDWVRNLLVNNCRITK